ncbi:MAG: hypothetical protein HQ508_09055 [Candidatus Marinimicrobia bacterium]|nr:hypothetical protein [Candidatus Neomarinimicrobiota bacterium]
MSNLEQLNINGQNILHRPASQPDASKGTLVLLHGYGADEYDLMGLAPHFDQNLQIICIRGPKSTVYGGASWFDIDMLPDGSFNFNAEQALDSTNVVVDIIRDFQSQKLITDERVILGGFSQGASISNLVTLKNPELIKALLIMSGRLMDAASKLLMDSQALLNLPVFAGHGTNDTVIPIEFGRQIVAFWGKLPVVLRHNEYPIGHEISQNELSHIQTWLESVHH